MPPTPVAVSFEDLLLSLAVEIRDQQARLDQDYRERFAAFLFLFQQAKESGFEALARAIAPSALALHNTEIETTFRFAHSVESQTSLSIQPVGVGFMSRYAYSEFAQCSLQWRVERIPLTPKTRSKVEPSA